MKRFLMSVVCLMLIIAAYESPGVVRQAVANDWAEFRGGDAQGVAVESKPPMTWTAEKNVVWKVGIAGQGWSSPIVYRNRIYLTSAVPREGGKPKDQSLRTLCLDPETGATVWDVEVFAQTDDQTENIHGKNSHASPTPVARDERIYIHFGTQGSACLSLDGEIIWSTKVLEYSPVHGNGSSPVITDNAMIVSCDGSNAQFVAALDIENGTLKWKKERLPTPSGVPQKFAFCSPRLIHIDGQDLVVSPAANNVIAYSPETGDEIWNVEYKGFSVVPQPVYGHGLIYVCTGFGTPSLLAIDPTGTGNATSTHIKWQTDRAVPHTPSLMLVGDEMYFMSDKGILTCVDAKTGKQHWQERIGGNYSASPVYADGKIYFPSEAGETVVVRASTTFEELARNTLDERIMATFTVDGDAFIVRTETQLYKIAERVE
ncbi:MAG: PQQ-binding-like beta-propeller repeat protein [Planctomycetota bacterium]|nr:PQQ-binding-like beta-propeller repeat protein [Planctomycetota bacterium]MDA1213255.1 PQQ-binding-like beta-propeller repeat protein [Planctomycetota bacterium]